MKQGYNIYRKHYSKLCVIQYYPITLQYKSLNFFHRNIRCLFFEEHFFHTNFNNPIFLTNMGK